MSQDFTTIYVKKIAAYKLKEYAAKQHLTMWELFDRLLTAEGQRLYPSQPTAPIRRGFTDDPDSPAMAIARLVGGGEPDNA